MSVLIRQYSKVFLKSAVESSHVCHADFMCDFLNGIGCLKQLTGGSFHAFSGLKFFKTRSGYFFQ